MNEKKLKKIFTYTVLSFVSFVLLFYFLTGEQLKFKDSIYNRGVGVANFVTDEIITGSYVEQDFKCDMDKLESISLVFTKQYREAKGNVYVEIHENGKTVLYKKLDAAEIPEQHVVTLEFNEPVEDCKGNTFTLKVSSDCKENLGVALMMTRNPDELNMVKSGRRYFRGSICLGLTGKDFIPMSSYYFPIMGVLTLVLMGFLVKSYKDYQNNKANLLIAGILAVERYYFLISQLVARDFKSKYKRSVLGIMWSFLNPLLTMTVQFLVFSTIFKADTRSYPVYLLAGVICYNFFKETTDMCLLSISGNARLINKVYIPKYIFPLARTVSSSINLGISLVPLLLVTLIMGLPIKPSILLMFYFLVCLIIFALGVGMFLAALMVFFRDIQFLWSVISQIWMYATPIFYTAEIIPEKFKFIVRFNPLYHFLGNIRKCLMDGISPEPKAYIYCLVFALISLAVGSFVFKKTQDKFTLYL